MPVTWSGGWGLDNPLGDPALVPSLRDRLGVSPDHVTDQDLTVVIGVAEHMVRPHVPEANWTHPLYYEAVTSLAVRVYEEQVRGRVGVDPDGDYDIAWTPGPTGGMVRSVWAYILPLTQTGGLTV